MVQEFFLGFYDAEATAAFNQNLSDISTLKDPRSKDASLRYCFINVKTDGTSLNTIYLINWFYVGIMLICIQTGPSVILQTSHERLR